MTTEPVYSGTSVVRGLHGAEPLLDQLKSQMHRSPMHVAIEEIYRHSYKYLRRPSGFCPDCFEWWSKSDLFEHFEGQMVAKILF